MGHLKLRVMTATVVYDPSLEIEAYGDADTVIVTNDAATVVVLRQGITLNALTRAIEDELAR